MNSLVFITLLAIFFPHGHIQAAAQPRLSNRTDQDALLSFKSLITKDDRGVLKNWNPNTALCSWNGVTCNPTKNRVTGITLGGHSLSGTLTPSISNLSFLQSLDLNTNSFHGTIPVDIGRLFRLNSLNLSSNSLHGSIPSSLTNCSKLRALDLSSNMLQGTIPFELGNLLKLEDLRFARNSLTGLIPISFGNLSSLANLILLSNNLQGPIPNQLGRLTNLLHLQLGNNNISGTIPGSIFNLSSLVILGLARNQISGDLPPNAFATLPNLTTLFVGGNLLQGRIPTSISNATKLRYLDLSTNRFTGEIPLLWGLPNIQILNFEINYLSSDGDEGLNFITSLTNSTRLQVFSVATNQLSGQLPSSIGNLSSQLLLLVMGDNHLEGSIPEEVGNIAGLAQISMEHNSFTGNIPPTLGKLQNLQNLYLDMNLLTGSIPESIGNLTHLYELGLRANNLTGKIPSTLGKCQHLQFMDLSANKLDWNIPKEIFVFPSMGKLLNLSWNSLSGSLPSEIGSLKMVQGIDISNNRLTGMIPSTIGDCSNLLYLDLSRNSFQGKIPDSLARLKGIEYIYLSSNNLSGPIPPLDNLQYLRILNLSYNHLQGEVPKGGIFSNASSVFLSENPGLCSANKEFELPNCASSKKQPHKSNKVIVIAIGAGAAAISILLIILCFFLMGRKMERNAPEDLISFEDDPRRLYSYYDLKSATQNFSEQNLIGEGSFGVVYRGTMRDGNVVAIKVFNMDQRGASKSFLDECEAIRNIRHRNLVKILSACSTTTFKALVLQFMVNGSLERWLHHWKGDRRQKLSLKQRLDIAIDVASAMEYLHHDCEPPFAHCDLKPSNVLLDQDMTAHVGDFGLARMLQGTSFKHQTSNTIGLKGSIGYMAPEYGYGGGVSAKGDVYSFGILFMELLTGKKPTDKMFHGELNVQKWVGAMLPDQVGCVLDDELMENPSIRAMDQIISLLKLCLHCANETSEGRPEMKEVAGIIKRIRAALFANS